MANTKNLKPFKSGTEWTGNAGGRPKKRPITDEYWKASEEPMPPSLIRRFNRHCGVTLLKAGDTWSRGVAVRAHYEAAMKGSIRAAREIREAIEGKAPQRPEITGPERKEITLRVQYVDRPKLNELDPHDPANEVSQLTH